MPKFTRSMVAPALLASALAAAHVVAAVRVEPPTGLDGVATHRLEARLQAAYAALPRGAEGLPDSSGVRYLARRYLQAEHGWLVRGLDTSPWRPTSGGNASQAAALRAAQLLLEGEGAVGQTGSPAQTALLAALLSDAARGFTLREAAEVIGAIEEMVAAHDVALMRRARALSRVQVGRDATKAEDHHMQKALLFYAALSYSGSHGADMVRRGLDRQQAARRAMEEASLLRAEFAVDMAAEPLESVVSSAASKAAAKLPSSGAHVYDGMRSLRDGLRERHASGCRRLRGVLSSMDHEGTGQVRYAESYATKMQDWALLETPEYLSAVGAAVHDGIKGGGPGVLIPNYVAGINSCRDPGAHPTMMCCPDECEVDILPRLEAAARGPRVAPRQAWAALGRLVKADKMISADKRKELHSHLRALGLKSADGLVEVHGRRMGSWLHRAFPHKCRAPPAANAPLVVDPDLSPAAWRKAGKYLPMDAKEVEHIRAHLQTRWGPGNDGADIRSFAARSEMSLDQELELIHKFHLRHNSGGIAVQQALEDALNVRVLDRCAVSEHLVAMVLAAVAGGPLIVALVLALQSVNAVLLALGAAARTATCRLPTCPPIVPRVAAASEEDPAAGSDSEASTRECEADSPRADKGEPSLAGETDSDVAGHISGESSETEEEEEGEEEEEAASTVPAGAEAAAVHSSKEEQVDLPAADSLAPVDMATSDEHPSQIVDDVDSDEKPWAAPAPQAFPAAAAEDPPSWGQPRPIALPKGFRPPPGLDAPPGLELQVVLSPQWRRPAATLRTPPPPQPSDIEGPAWQTSQEGARLMSLVCRQLQ